MKYCWFFFLLFVISIVKAQQSNHYHYIQVPQKFSDFDEDEFQLNFYLKQLLRKNNYIVLDENESRWPEEAKNNPCLILTADVVKQKRIFKNGLNLKLINCKNQEEGLYSGVSKIKDFDKGYQQALLLAVDSMGQYDPTIKIARTENSSVTNPIPETSNQTVIQKDDTTKQTEFLFVNDDKRVILSELRDGSFLLLQEQGRRLIAQLKPSSRKGVFQVTVVGEREKYTTTGFLDDKTLTIDFIENGKTKTTEFRKSN